MRYCHRCDREVGGVPRMSGASHFGHIAGAALTCGLWLVVYFPLVFMAGFMGPVCNFCGGGTQPGWAPRKKK